MNSTPTHEHWQRLYQLTSLGSTTKKPGSLAGLHATREKNLSQFFTPEWVVKVAWDSIKDALPGAGRLSVLDNGMGSGRQFRFCDAEHFTLCGFDVDAYLVDQVKTIFADTDYDTDFCVASMESVILSHYTCALINPAFSIPLSSPYLTPYDGITHYGVHGPDTSATSHLYAVAQALEHAELVTAVVPRSATETFQAIPWIRDRMARIYRLPNQTFIDEGVKSVSCDLIVFGAEDQTGEFGQPETIDIDETYQATPVPGLKASVHHRHSPIREAHIDRDKPVITLPATSDPRVILKRAGRWIKLEFFDGYTQGKVLNALYNHLIPWDRQKKRDRTIRYTGQMKLNLDVIILQPDPMAALQSVCDIITDNGGVPEVTVQLRQDLKRLIRLHEKIALPFGRTVYRKGSPDINATAKYTKLLNTTEKGAVVRQGEAVIATRTDTGFSVQTERGVFSCEHDLFFSLFDVPKHISDAGYWEQVNPPIKETYPDEIKAIEEKAKAFGLDQWLTWSYQAGDLYELAMKPSGAIIGWQMGLGKSRLAIALSMLLKGKTLLVLKSRLVNEMEIEIRKLGITEDQYTVIRDLKDIRQLNKLCIISYNTLKKPLAKGTRKLFADRLKKAFANVICDEGGLLANDLTAQSKAADKLHAKRKYIADGTPMPNYVTEFLPLAEFVFGSCRSYQPYSRRKIYLEPVLFNSARYHTTGRDAFIDQYVCYEWATNEFLDSGKGAKRMIPKVNNVARFRDFAAPMIKRRVQQEPDVAKDVTFPVPEINDPIVVDWDFKHLALYVDTAERFADWYKNYLTSLSDGDKGINLTLVLMKLEACFKATNAPIMLEDFGRPYTQLTTKERACIDLIMSELDEGRKPIVFAKNPIVLRRLEQELAKRDVPALVFDGTKTIDQRNRELDERIRSGQCDVMLSSYGVTQDGLNLPSQNSAIFYNRSYKAREELQSLYRLLRAEQKNTVRAWYLHLESSIDEYMCQLVDWKTFASEAGIDYGESPDDEDFLHFDQFINSYLASIPGLKDRITAYNRQQVA